MFPPDGLLTFKGTKRDVEYDPRIITKDPFLSDGYLDDFPPVDLCLVTTTEYSNMNTSEDEPASGVNGRLRPRKSTAPSPQGKTKIKPETKTSMDKPKRTSTPSKAPPTKQDDLASKSDFLPTAQFLCPYCDRKFASRQTVAKHTRRVHYSISKQDSFLTCLFCNHADADSGIIRHMVDSHPNQYFACLDCHARFSSTSELAEHKLNVCEKQKVTYRIKPRQKVARGTKKAKKSLNTSRKINFSKHANKDFQEGHGFNGIVISCELKPPQDHDGADIEDNITTNLILPPSKNLGGNIVLDKNALIVLDEIQWNKRIPPNFAFHNTDPDQILSRLGVVHRSPRTGESTRKDWFKALDDATQKFERCFDTKFYSKVASNVHENLAKFLDGSFNFNPDPDSTIKTRKTKNNVLINTAEGFPILLAREQFSRSLFDSYLPRAIAPKHKWKWDNLENDRSLMTAAEILKRDSHTNNCIITLVSSLDIWTQLSMRHKFDEKFNVQPVEKKTEKQNIISQELKEILESRDIPTSSQIVKRCTHKPAARGGELGFPASLGLVRATPTYELRPAVLSGEWVRPRCLVCCACGEQSTDCRGLSGHIATKHPNASVQCYEIVGEPLLNADILKHLYVPPRQMCNRTRPPRGFRECTKCNKSVTPDDLHQHMVECAGDAPTARRRQPRQRPFGVRRRRARMPDNTMRKKIRKDIRTRRRQKTHIGPRPRIRTEVGDAETIRKMLADLPAKRHRVLVNPLNMMQRPRRKLDMQRNKLLMRKRSTDEKSRKQIINKSKSDDKDGSTMSDDTNKNASSLEDDEDNKPLKPKMTPTPKTALRRREPMKRQSVVISTAKRRPLRATKRKVENDEKTIEASGDLDVQDNSIEKPERIDIKKVAYKTREHAANRGSSNNRDGQRAGGSSSGTGGGGAGGGGNGGGGDNYCAPASNAPLKHSIARLTANSETHDKSVQFHHSFLVQQECNNTNQHVPTGQRTLFENEAVVSKLDKPPLITCQQGSSDVQSQKNKANKPRKGLNDCIAMLRNKLVEPEPGPTTGYVSVQCGSDEPIDDEPRVAATPTSDLNNLTVTEVVHTENTKSNKNLNMTSQYQQDLNQKNTPTPKATSQIQEKVSFEPHHKPETTKPTNIKQNPDNLQELEKANLSQYGQEEAVYGIKQNAEFEKNIQLKKNMGCVPQYRQETTHQLKQIEENTQLHVKASSVPEHRPQNIQRVTQSTENFQSPEKVSLVPQYRQEPLRNVNNISENSQSPEKVNLPQYRQESFRNFKHQEKINVSYQYRQETIQKLKQSSNIQQYLEKNDLHRYEASQKPRQYSEHIKFPENLSVVAYRAETSQQEHLMQRHEAIRNLKQNPEFLRLQQNLSLIPQYRQETSQTLMHAPELHYRQQKSAFHVDCDISKYNCQNPNTRSRRNSSHSQASPNIRSRRNSGHSQVSPQIRSNHDSGHSQISPNIRSRRDSGHSQVSPQIRSHHESGHRQESQNIRSRRDSGHNQINLNISSHHDYGNIQMSSQTRPQHASGHNQISPNARSRRDSGNSQNNLNIRSLYDFGHSQINPQDPFHHSSDQNKVSPNIRPRRDSSHSQINLNIRHEHDSGHSQVSPNTRPRCGSGHSQESPNSRSRRPSVQSEVSPQIRSRHNSGHNQSAGTINEFSKRLSTEVYNETETTKKETLEIINTWPSSLETHPAKSGTILPSNKHSISYLDSVISCDNPEIRLERDLHFSQNFDVYADGRIREIPTNIPPAHASTIVESIISAPLDLSSKVVNSIPTHMLHPNSCDNYETLDLSNKKSDRRSRRDMSVAEDVIDLRVNTSHPRYSPANLDLCIKPTTIKSADLLEKDIHDDYPTDLSVKGKEACSSDKPQKAIKSADEIQDLSHASTLTAPLSIDNTYMNDVPETTSTIKKLKHVQDAKENTAESKDITDSENKVIGMPDSLAQIVSNENETMSPTPNPEINVSTTQTVSSQHQISEKPGVQMQKHIYNPLLKIPENNKIKAPVTETATSILIESVPDSANIASSVSHDQNFLKLPQDSSEVLKLTMISSLSPLTGVVTKHPIPGRVITTSNNKTESTTPVYTLANATKESSKAAVLTSTLLSLPGSTIASTTPVYTLTGTTMNAQAACNDDLVNGSSRNQPYLQSFARPNDAFVRDHITKNMQQEEITKDLVAEQDPETAKKIAMLPKELVDILGNMPIDHRNQLLNVLPQYVSTTVSNYSTSSDANQSIEDSLTTIPKTTEPQTGKSANDIMVLNPQHGQSEDKKHSISYASTSLYDISIKESLYINDEVHLTQVKSRKNSNEEDKPKLIDDNASVIDLYNNQDRIIDLTEEDNITVTKAVDVPHIITVPQDFSTSKDTEILNKQNRNNNKTSSLRAVRIKAPSLRHKEKQSGDSTGQEVAKCINDDEIHKPQNNNSKLSNESVLVSGAKELPVEIIEIAKEEIKPSLAADIVINDESADLVTASTRKSITPKTIENSLSTKDRDDFIKSQESVETLNENVKDNIENDTITNTSDSSKKVDNNNLHEPMKEKRTREEEEDSEDDIILAAIVKQKQKNTATRVMPNIKKKKNKKSIKNLAKETTIVNDKGTTPDKEGDLDYLITSKHSQKCPESLNINSNENNSKLRSKVSQKVKNANNQLQSDVKLNIATSKSELTDKKVNSYDQGGNIVTHGKYGKEINDSLTKFRKEGSLHSEGLSKPSQMPEGSLPILSIDIKQKGKSKKKNLSLEVNLNVIDEEKSKNEPQESPNPKLDDKTIMADNQQAKHSNPKNQCEETQITNCCQSDRDELKSEVKINTKNDSSKEHLNECISKDDAIPEFQDHENSNDAPLRRSRRGKSLFVEDVLPVLERVAFDSTADQRGPITKKQLIFSKLLDEEKQLSLVSNQETEFTSTSKIQEATHTPVINNIASKPKEINASELVTSQKCKSIKRKKSPQIKRKSKKKKSIDDKITNEDTLMVEPVSSIKNNSEISSEVLVSAVADTVASVEIMEYDKPKEKLTRECDRKHSGGVSEGAEIALNNNKSNSNSDSDNTGLKQNKSVLEKRKISKLSSTVDFEQTSKPKKNKLSIIKETDSNEVLKKDARSASPVSVDLEQSAKSENLITTCYDVPVAARRTRSKSVIVKSSSAELYDPYNIDLDDMIQKPEPLRKLGIKSKEVKSKRKSSSKLMELKVSDKKEQSEHIDLETEVIKNDIKQNKSDASPPVHSKYVNESQVTNINKSANDKVLKYKKTVDDVDKVSAKNISHEYQASETQNFAIKDTVDDSDDSTKSDEPLKKYVEGKVKKMATKSKAQPTEDNADVPHNEQDTDKMSNGCKKVLRTATGGKSVSNEMDEQMRSEQFMESFGFFSERKPRKSNLLATKKISETFHIIANEGEDYYSSSRSSRKSVLADSKKSNHVGHIQPLKKNLKRGRKKKDKEVETKIVSCFCKVCKKEYRRPDTFLRHQMTFLHIMKMAEVELKMEACYSLLEAPNYLFAYKQHMDRLKILTEKAAKQRKNAKVKIVLPGLEEILADVMKSMKDQQVCRRGLSHDEVLFLDCCELLKGSRRQILPALPMAVLPNALPSVPGSLESQLCSLPSTSSSLPSTSNVLPSTLSFLPSTSSLLPSTSGSQPLPSSQQPMPSLIPPMSRSLLPLQNLLPTPSTSRLALSCTVSSLLALPSTSCTADNVQYQPLSSETNFDYVPKAIDNKDVKSDDDVDSVTAKLILESEEVRFLENDLINNLKEAANAKNAKILNEYYEASCTLTIHPHEISTETFLQPDCHIQCQQIKIINQDFSTPMVQQRVPVVEQIAPEIEDNAPVVEQIAPVPEKRAPVPEKRAPVPEETNKTKKVPEYKEKMYPDIIEDIDMFEDKFDKIKRKCRSQAAAAKQVQNVTEPSPGHKGRKKNDKKKGKKSSKKNCQNTVLTKGALKGFDGIKVSIPTSDINMSAIVPPHDSSQKKKRKTSSKKKREKRDSETSKNHDSYHRKDSLHSQKKVDVYEFMDNEDAELFEFRPSTLMERFKSISKETPSTSKRDPQADEANNSSESASDGDDFVYMSDDYVCSDDETENSMLSCELGSVKSDAKKPTTQKRKDTIEKNAVMGKIFKHNAVRNEKKHVKNKDTVKPKANLDQLFDSLLEDEPNSSILDKDSPKPDETDSQKSQKCSPRNDSSSFREGGHKPRKKSTSSDVLNLSKPIASTKKQESVHELPISSYDAAKRYKYQDKPSTSKQVDDIYGPSTSSAYNMVPPVDREDTPPRKSDSSPKKCITSSKNKSPLLEEDNSELEELQTKKSLLDKIHDMHEADYSADFDEDTGVARHRARRKCTVGKQNVLAETWSSESEPDGLPPRPASADSVVAGAGRKKKGRKRDGQQAFGRRGKVTFNKKQDSESRVTSNKWSTPSNSTTSNSGVGGERSNEPCPPPAPPALPGPSTSGVSGSDADASTSRARPRASTFYWSSEGDEEQLQLQQQQQQQQQHGWIVGNSHKRLVTMLAHAKERKRNNDDKRVVE